MFWPSKVILKMLSMSFQVIKSHGSLIHVLLSFDHMTSCYNLFTSYFPCYGNQKVRIADNTLSSIVGKGPIPISKNLTLNFVLPIPNLSCNLFSVSKFTRDSNCIAKFSIYFVIKF